MRLSVGLFSYLNCLPLARALKAVMPDLELVRAEPTRLNQWVVTGRVAVGGVSAVTYALYQDSLYLVPRLCIASRGPVRSVLLVSKLPAEELGGRRVLLTRASATSQVLVQLILSRLYGVRPHYAVGRVSLDQGLREADAYLLIGDEALAAYHSPPAGAWLYDLGAEWYRLTGQPMVYALWACRRAWAVFHSEALGEMVARLEVAAGLAQQGRAAMAAVAARSYPYGEEFLRDYLLGLDYELDAAAQAGLLTFYRLAWEEGLLAAPPPTLDFLQGGQGACLGTSQDGLTART